MTSAPRSTRCDVMAAGPSSEHSSTRTPSSMGFGWVTLFPSAGPDDGLHLGVGEDAEVAAVAADAAPLSPPERGLVVALGGVDADVAGAQALGDGIGPLGVAREHVVVETEVARVGD